MEVDCADVSEEQVRQHLSEGVREMLGQLRSGRGKLIDEISNEGFFADAARGPSTRSKVVEQALREQGRSWADASASAGSVVRSDRTALRPLRR